VSDQQHLNSADTAAICEILYVSTNLACILSYLIKRIIHHEALLIIITKLEGGPPRLWPT
jgi:hypothetical protein